MEAKHAYQYTASRFPAQVAIILLTASATVEVASFFGLSPSVTSFFRYPLDRIMSSVSLVFGLLGAYGLLRDNVTGAYSALLNSILQIICGCYLLIGFYGPSYLNLSLTIFAVASLALGSLTLICVFSIDHRKPKMASMRLIDPFLSDPEGGSVTINKYALETIDVTKRYILGSNVVSAIDGVNMKIRKGEFVAIMGPSGSGKSTLLNLIGALDRSTSGKVLIDGVDISMLNDTALAKLRNEKIGFVFQAYNLIARSSVLRNMELPALVKGYPRDERLDKISEILGVVGLSDKVSRKPKTLSGGEQQRVAIARALVNDPEIILADEPTGNVDSKTGQMIIGFLRKLNLEKGTTVIVVTHDPDVAKWADKILYLRDGKVVQEEAVGGLPK